jgi:peptidyl-prolyl cis-trans isomerase C/foldase protein PrsA
MRRIATFLPLLAFLSMLSGCEWVQNLWGENTATKRPSDWAALVDDYAITERMLRIETLLVAGDLAPEAGSLDAAAVHESMLDELIARRLFLTEAMRRKIVLGPDVVDERLAEIYGDAKSETIKEAAAKAGVSAEDLRAHMREVLLVEKLFMEDIYPRLLVRDDELRAAYERDPKAFSKQEALHVLQVVVANEEDAQLAYRRLRAGESFADVAREVSLGTEAERGGDMGWVSEQSLPAPLNEIVFKLPRRMINRPVKSDYGYHIFRIDGHHPGGDLSYQDAEPLLRRIVFEEKKRQAESDLLKQLKAQTPITRRPASQKKG